MSALLTELTGRVGVQELVSDSKNCWTRKMAVKRDPNTNALIKKLSTASTESKLFGRIIQEGQRFFVSQMGRRLDYYHNETGPQCFHFQFPLHPNPKDIPSLMFYCSPDPTSRMWKL